MHYFNDRVRKVPNIYYFGPIFWYHDQEKKKLPVHRYSYMVEYVIKFVVIINRRWEKLIYLWTGSFFSLGHDFKILRQNDKCLELFWPYRWSNAFGIQWYITSVTEGVLYEIFGNKCSKILKFWRTELSYAQNKNGGEEMRLLGMDTYPSLNDITEIRCNKCTRSEQGYDF
jgi:hypothetical protein